MNFDDNALFRHQDIDELRDLDEEDPLEVEASKFDLNYIKLDGNVGCMVNGAGLAMATMDIIKFAGGEPGELPRRRRRRQRGAGQERDPDHPLGPEREGDPHQHLRRHHAVRRHRRGRRRRPSRRSAARSPSSSASRGRTSRRAKAILRDSGLAVIPADGMKDAAEKIIAAVAKGGTEMASWLTPRPASSSRA